MAEKSEKNKPFDPDDRFRYIGFEVKPGKIGEFFKSEAEKKLLVDKVKAKREKGEKLREHCTLTVERVAPYEKIVMTITSLVLIASLFLPWFSGYREVVVETTPAAPAVNTSPAMPADSMALTGTESIIPPEPVESAAAETAPETEPGTAITATTDEGGFSSISATRQRRQITREHESLSALGALTSLGTMGKMAFGSGAVVMLTSVLLLIYMLFVLVMAFYTLYLLYGTKGNPDQQALAIKKGARLSWLSLAFYGIMLIISFAGGSYSFDPKGMIVQLGDSYGPGAFLGLLSYGYYISIGCFVMNAVKGSEI